jgi:hypothetical protein
MCEGGPCGCAQGSFVVEDMGLRADGSGALVFPDVGETKTLLVMRDV